MAKKKNKRRGKKDAALNTAALPSQDVVADIKATSDEEKNKAKDNNIASSKETAKKDTVVGNDVFYSTKSETTPAEGDEGYNEFLSLLKGELEDTIITAVSKDEGDEVMEEDGVPNYLPNGLSSANTTEEAEGSASTIEDLSPMVASRDSESSFIGDVDLNENNDSESANLLPPLPDIQVVEEKGLLDGDEKKDSDETSLAETDDTTKSPPSPQETVAEEAEPEPTSNWWNWNDLMKAAFCVEPKKKEVKNVTENEDVLRQAKAFEEAHQSAEILIRVLLRTLTVARASVPDRPKLHLALASCHEVLLFVRQILRVQETHTSKQLIEAWFRALHEISETFGPLKQRTAALGVQIGKKFKKHGSIAKRRLLRFVDIVLGDTRLLHALELGDWKLALSRLEVAIVKAGVTDAATCDQLHKGAVMMVSSSNRSMGSELFVTVNQYLQFYLSLFLSIKTSPRVRRIEKARPQLLGTHTRWSTLRR